MFKRSAFTTGRIEDVSIQIEYGTYEIALLYTDQEQKLVYQICAEERDSKYEIFQPEFQATLKICSEDAHGGEKPAGEVTIIPSANVTLTPTLYKPKDSPTSPPAIADGNPFAGSLLYINPKYAQSVLASAKKEAPELAAKMQKLSSISTAIWIDNIARITEVEAIVKAAQEEKNRTQKSLLLTLVIYNLPNRDCAANASAGELLGSANGLERYKKEYIDRIAALIKKHSELKFILIIEPDSLPNMATNMGQEKCVVAAPLYKQGVAYAIKQLAQAHTALYLDAAHGGWLGWAENRRKMAMIFDEVLKLAGGSHLIRGFASNVSNYSPLVKANPDPNPESYYQTNPARDELTFVNLLAQDLKAAGLKNVNFVIDTSRNGQAKTRNTWGSWCNVRGAGVGERPRVAPAAGIDAFIWVKPPGESDGVSDAQAPRFDTSCVSADSLAGAPQAGEWFHEQFKMLVTNAFPAL